MHLKYQIKFTNQFKRDVELSTKQGKDTDKLFKVVEQLANDIPLEKKYKNQELSGDYKGYYECQIGC